MTATNDTPRERIRKMALAQIPWLIAVAIALFLTAITTWNAAAAAPPQGHPTGSLRRSTWKPSPKEPCGSSGQPPL